ncbi:MULTISPECIES: nickel transporter permease [Thermomicrobium]|jgi:peptide/nickel transport system permease protein|uniref:Inner membrane ABC transporter permease protein yddQ n=1 Tax=Thermomicrobium roseum (strain ATCC 27502 / DSM 5159 / P-2) TaxID=309801 RepID=B9L1M0_THERP|nr:MULTISPECIES: nickel transporter permease [Thermomicrobium]ACM05341.1 inner membrane ABC transporter permease protein yddQ [Thermomicrobium roseum DSM 5159]MBO9358500.1 ABC transporter permease [Thermomicrobium sp.]
MERTTTATTRPVTVLLERPPRQRTLSSTVIEFLRHSPLNLLGVVLIALFLFLVVFGSVLAPHDPIQPNVALKLQPPSSTYWFGTDELGRDVFSRVLSGAKYSLGIAFIILSIAVVVGTLVGLIAGYVGGLVDELLMRLTDLFLAFPALVLAMAIAATLGRNLQNTVIALTVVYWPWYARLVRGQVLWLKEREFIEAARAIGASPWRIVGRHILPNTLAVIIVQLTLDVGYAVLATSGLSFLGLGAQPPTPEWGTMIAGARTFFRDAWWYITFPGLALTLTVLGFNLLGDGLRDFLDPRTRRR